MQNIDQTLNSQKTPHSSPSRASYAVFFVSIVVKIVSIIMAAQHTLCSREGITFVSVHDCFWTHAADVPKMNQVREIREVLIFFRKHTNIFTFSTISQN